ncbi:hypothetical protein A7K93_11345 [Candidatus Methylacidiphilum fumarolicum]|nr:hypothetical protein A7K73_03160 [Candidatus Methylacidiphilum fumarolicum]TFE71170.1 hypothetical protein A7K93_11345 [Candidatus Methylacidiphilum fumarolicum]TFE72972.1 hypothetical protein A7K72_07490 [Candidatus Methylacidiphilum fumarolicum]TFE77113.1 hypothetical protein A7D33_00435 [Candidatus Methylacidiphilum fumarolicum]
MPGGVHFHPTGRCTLSTAHAEDGVNEKKSGYIISFVIFYKKIIYILKNIIIKYLKRREKLFLFFSIFLTENRASAVAFLRLEYFIIAQFFVIIIFRTEHHFLFLKEKNICL